MAERRPPPPRSTTVAPTTTSSPSAFLRKLHHRAPNHPQLMGFLTLVISGGILLLLTGITVTATVTGLIFFAPLIVVSSPIWFPVAAVLLVSAVGLLSFCGFGVTALATGSWVFRYVRGHHPPGSDRVDYARSRIADTASHVREYAKGYGGGYLDGKVRDAAAAGA